MDKKDTSKAEQDNTGIGLHTLVSAAMMWDDEKTALWFDTPNPLLGGVSPNWMLDRGRNDKLGRFIRACLDENSPLAAPTQTVTFVELANDRGFYAGQNYYEAALQLLADGAKWQREQSPADNQENLRTVLKAFIEATEHAIELGHLGEGSTRGLFNDCVHEGLLALKAARPDSFPDGGEENGNG